MTPEEILQDRVYDGARWLDEHYPGWDDEVNLDVLNMASADRDVLAYAVPKAERDGHFAWDWLRGPESPHADWLKAEIQTEEGLVARTRLLGFNAAYDYEPLNEAWKRLITERREAG
jgi:hypothetical protein